MTPISTPTTNAVPVELPVVYSSIPLLSGKRQWTITVVYSCNGTSAPDGILEGKWIEINRLNQQLLSTLLYLSICHSKLAHLSTPAIAASPLKLRE
jgi:hypothetical protein